MIFLKFIFYSSVLFNLQYFVVGKELLKKAVCESVEISGELRSKSHHKCIKYQTPNTQARIANFLVMMENVCTGNPNQEYIICSDKSVRNKQTNHCLTNKKDEEGMKLASLQGCNQMMEEGIDADRQWTKVDTETFRDAAGIEHQYFMLKNQNLCLTKTDNSNSGILSTKLSFTIRTCEVNNDKQLFYFRQRGKAIDSGNLVNKEYIKCLEVNINEEIQFNDCTIGDPLGTRFTLYENGDMRIKRKVPGKEDEYKCLTSDVDGYLLLEYCSGQDIRAVWEFNYCDGKQCAMINQKEVIRNGKKSKVKQCLTGVDESNQFKLNNFKLKSTDCLFTPQQRFEWSISGFTKPELSYFKRGCNEHGSMSMEIADELTYTGKHETGFEAEVSAALEGSIGFAEASVETSFASSIANAWGTENKRNTKVIMSCDYTKVTVADKAKEEFKGGCMWQVQVAMDNIKQQQKLEWTPKLITCTADGVAPKCPLFTVCDPQSVNCHRCVSVETANKRKRKTHHKLKLTHKNMAHKKNNYSNVNKTLI